MPREELQQASQALREAAETVADDDIEERIYDQSNAMAELATRERGPDQGRLDRHMQKLQEIANGLEGHGQGEAKASVEEAYEHLRDYRETVEGV